MSSEELQFLNNYAVDLNDECFYVYCGHRLYRSTIRAMCEQWQMHGPYFSCPICHMPWLYDRYRNRKELWDAHQKKINDKVWYEEWTRKEIYETEALEFLRLCDKEWFAKRYLQRDKEHKERDVWKLENSMSSYRY
jgi:hypothetical protein